MRENRIPAPLKMVVYRSIETALKAIGAAGAVTDVKVALPIEDHDLTLVDEENGGASAPARELAYESGELQSPLSTIRDRTVLSGGKLALLRTTGGATTLRVCWESSPGSKEAQSFERQLVPGRYGRYGSLC